MKAMDTPAVTERKGTRRPVWRRWLPLILLIGLMGLVIFNGWHRLLSLETVAKAHDQYQTYITAHFGLSIVGYIAVYTTAVALSVPGALWLTFAGGSMFGWVAGGAAAVAGATIGASIVFGIARTAIGEALVARLGVHVAKLQAGFRENAFSYMLALRLVPAFPFFVVNLVPAILGVPFRTYLMATFLGIMPATFAFASIGAGLDSVIASARAAQAICIAMKTATECPLAIQLRTLVTTEMKIALVLLAILALIPIAVKKWRQRHAGQH